MDLTHDDVLQILKIIDESDYDDVRLEIGDLKLHVQKQGSAEPELPQARPEREQTVGAATPAPASASSAPAVAPPASRAAEEAIPEGHVAVRAPMLGTFYRAPSPGEKPFVEVGDRVGANDTVCLVEVMKLFNSIKAEVAGTVVKILVENATMVEHGQPLMLIEPDASNAAE